MSTACLTMGTWPAFRPCHCTTKFHASSGKKATEPPTTSCFNLAKGWPFWSVRISCIISVLSTGPTGSALDSLAPDAWAWTLSSQVFDIIYVFVPGVRGWLSKASCNCLTRLICSSMGGISMLQLVIVLFQVGALQAHLLTSRHLPRAEKYLYLDSQPPAMLIPQFPHSRLR